MGSIFIEYHEQVQTQAGSHMQAKNGSSLMQYTSSRVINNGADKPTSQNMRLKFLICPFWVASCYMPDKI